MVAWTKLGAVEVERSLGNWTRFTGCPDRGRMTDGTVFWLLKLFIWKWHVNISSAHKSHGHANFKVVGKCSHVLCPTGGQIEWVNCPHGRPPDAIYGPWKEASPAGFSLPLNYTPTSCNGLLLVNCIHNNAVKQPCPPMQWLENISFSCSHIFGLAGVWQRLGAWPRGHVQVSLFLLGPVGWQSSLFPWWWQKHKRASPTLKAHVKPLPVSYLLTSIHQSNSHGQVQSQESEKFGYGWKYYTGEWRHNR